MKKRRYTIVIFTDGREATISTLDKEQALAEIGLFSGMLSEGYAIRPISRNSKKLGLYDYNEKLVAIATYCVV